MNKQNNKMKYNPEKGFELKGQLDIITTTHQENVNGIVETWNEVYIHGNPKGLTSLANLLIKIASINQNKIPDYFLPKGAREHYHLRPGLEISKSSCAVIVGRLDAKESGLPYKGFVDK